MQSRPQSTCSMETLGPRGSESQARLLRPPDRGPAGGKVTGSRSRLDVAVTLGFEERDFGDAGHHDVAGMNVVKVRGRVEAA